MNVNKKFLEEAIEFGKRLPAMAAALGIDESEIDFL